jgi:hypothetical protein
MTPDEQQLARTIVEQNSEKTVTELRSILKAAGLGLHGQAVRRMLDKVSAAQDGQTTIVSTEVRSNRAVSLTANLPPLSSLATTDASSGVSLFAAIRRLREDEKQTIALVDELQEKFALLQQQLAERHKRRNELVSVLTAAVAELYRS